MTHFALNKFYDFYDGNYREGHAHCDEVFFKGDMLEFEHIADNRQVNDAGTQNQRENHGAVQVRIVALCAED